MKRTATHQMTVNSDGTSHLEPLATNCAGGRCGRADVKNVPEGSRSRTPLETLAETVARRTRKPTPATTNDLAAMRRGYLARAEREAGTDRAASLGIAADIASVIDKRADGPFAWVQPIIGGEDEAEIED